MALPQGSLGSPNDRPATTLSPELRSSAIQDALGHLRRMVNNHELAERIPVELCLAGYGRVLFSLIQNNNWVARSAHATGDEALSSALLQTGRAHPRRLCRPLPESAMVRTKTPILVDRPQFDPRVHTQLVAVARPQVYVAAPVYVWQIPVALLHADAPGEAGDVGPGDRDVLGVFAEGLGAIMERNIVLERMQAMQRSATEHLGIIDSFTSPLQSPMPASAAAHQPAAPAAAGLDSIADTLTRREFQVLNLLAAGKTNAQIASRLFVSEGTVKSHLRNIMHKLQASNRTEAVARYRRLTAGIP